MKKLFLSFAVVAGIVLASCNNKAEEAATEATEAATEAVTETTETVTETVEAVVDTAAAAVLLSTVEAVKEEVKK
jgi:uncharacterized lipoprotein NlpE involved in copper resistance